MRKIIVVDHLRKYFRAKTELATLFSSKPPRVVKAVDDVSFYVGEGEILGLVGESGSGKTTIARLITRLEQPDSGEIYIDSHRIAHLKGNDLKGFYRNVQMIFQDPYESINPRFRVYDTVVEPIFVQDLAPRTHYLNLAGKALTYSGLKPPSEYLNRFPHELSGGERQRLSIARALVLNPKVLVADEPVSMLDVSIKAGILNLLKGLSHDLGMAIVYVSHDLSTVKYLCDRIIIMYLGRFMEIGSAEEVIDKPRHPYSEALRAAIPVPDPSFERERRVSININEKSSQEIAGCRYRPDCRKAMDICYEVEPEMEPISEGHFVACHLYQGIDCPSI